MKKTDILKFKPLEITPLIPIEVEPLSPAPKIFEQGDGPEPTQEQIQKFSKNYKQITAPLVKRQLRQHKKDTMHGAYSVNEQVSEDYKRPTKDIDVWSNSPKKRAIQIENQLDKKAGCDIAHVEEKHIGTDSNRLMGIGPPSEQKEPEHKRYLVVTKPKDDLDVDYTTYPNRVYHRRLFQGFYHESLQSAHDRAKELARTQPIRSFKASEDVERIEKYWESKKKKVKK